MGASLRQVDRCVDRKIDGSVFGNHEVAEWSDPLDALVLFTMAVLRPFLIVLDASDAQST